jgi:hypothetical protein
MHPSASAWSNYGRNYDRGTPVAARVEAIGATSAKRTAMETEAAAACYLSYHSGWGLIGHKWHGLYCSRRHTKANSESKSEELFHLGSP